MTIFNNNIYIKELSKNIGKRGRMASGRLDFGWSTGSPVFLILSLYV